MGGPEDATEGSTRSASIDFAAAEQYDIYGLWFGACPYIQHIRIIYIHMYIYDPDSQRAEPRGCHAA